MERLLVKKANYGQAMELIGVKKWQTVCKLGREAQL
jgi:hypothetical protein